MIVLDRKSNRLSRNQPMDRFSFLRILGTTLKKKARVSRMVKKSKPRKLRLPISENNSLPWETSTLMMPLELPIELIHPWLVLTIRLELLVTS